MKIILFGASGKVGSYVTEELIKRGHTVTVFVHSSGNFSESNRLHIAHGDVHNLASVEAALRGNDAVISCLGSWGTERKDILSSAMNTIIPTMQKLGIKRIVTLTGSAARSPSDNRSLVQSMIRFTLMIFGKNILMDGEAHLRSLSSSNLVWTSVRSPIMQSMPTTHYVFNTTPPAIWATISRYSVVYAICDLIESNKFAKKAPFIH
jgi:putative NADH-flavin reductase